MHHKQELITGNLLFILAAVRRSSPTLRLPCVRHPNVSVKSLRDRLLQRARMRKHCHHYKLYGGARTANMATTTSRLQADYKL